MRRGCKGRLEDSGEEPTVVLPSPDRAAVNISLSSRIGETLDELLLALRAGLISAVPLSDVCFSYSGVDFLSLSRLHFLPILQHPGSTRAEKRRPHALKTDFSAQYRWIRHTWRVEQNLERYFVRSSKAGRWYSRAAPGLAQFCKGAMDIWETHCERDVQVRKALLFIFLRKEMVSGRFADFCPQRLQRHTVATTNIQRETT